MYRLIYKTCARCNKAQTTTKFCLICRPLAYRERQAQLQPRYAGRYKGRYKGRIRTPESIARSAARKAWRYVNDPEYRAAKIARAKARRGPRRPKRRKEGLLLECTSCRKMLPRGWFARNGQSHPERHGHCRECRRESRSANAARRRNAGVAKIPRGWIRRLMTEQRGLCGICGLWLGPQFHVDHRRPISKGGKHEYINLQLTHKICNLRSSNKLK